MRDRIILALAIAAAALTPLPALADARNDVMAGMIRCAAVTDDRQWLDCYYGAAQPMRAQLGLPPAPQAQLRLLQSQPLAATPVLPLTLAPAVAAGVPVRTGPPPMPRTSGLLNVSGGKDVVTNAPISSYEVRKDGFTVTLLDGQVWSQTARDAIVNPAHWRQPASTMRVTISQASMHTFNLVVNDENAHFKVERVH